MSDATPSPLVRVSDAGSVSDARLDELIVHMDSVTPVLLRNISEHYRACDDTELALRELRQLRALAEERRLGPREG